MIRLFLVFFFCQSLLALPGDVFIALDNSGTNALPSTQTTNLPVIIQSSAPDSTKSFLLKNSNAQTSGSFLGVENSGTNLLTLNYAGVMYLNEGFSYWGDTADATLISHTGTNRQWEIYVDNSGDGSGSYGFLDLFSSPQGHVGFSLLNHTANGNSGLDGNAGEDSLFMSFFFKGNSVTLLNPLADDGNAAYLFDTVTNHTSGNLVEFKNNGTPKFSLNYNGVVQNVLAVIATDGASTATLGPDTVSTSVPVGGSNNTITAFSSRFTINNSGYGGTNNWVDFVPQNSDNPTNPPFQFRANSTFTGTNQLMQVLNGDHTAQFVVTPSGLRTDVPSGATNAMPFKIGQIANGSALTLIATNYVQIEVNGVAYKLGLVQ